jgi:hypothetical protein
MRIGELAKLSGVSVGALRYYEEQGLSVPMRVTESRQAGCLDGALLLDPPTRRSRGLARIA